MRKLLKYITGYDLVLILSVIALSAAFIMFPFINVFDGNKAAEKTIVIQSSRGTQQRIPAVDTYSSEPLLIKVKGPIGTSIVEAYKGKVRLKEAPPADPEKICEKTGWIGQPGPVIICVPNQISIWIETRENDIDGISW